MQNVPFQPKWNCATCLKQNKQTQTKTLFSLSVECWGFRSSKLQIWHIVAMRGVFCSHQAGLKKLAVQKTRDVKSSCVIAYLQKVTCSAFLKWETERITSGEIGNEWRGTQKKKEKKCLYWSGDTSLLLIVSCSGHCVRGVGTIFKSTEWRKWERRPGFVMWD